MVGPEGDRRLFGGSLHGLAKLTIIENDGQSVQFALYVPFLPPRSRAGRPPGTEGAVPHVNVDAPCSVDRYTGKWPPGGTEEEDLTEPASCRPLRGPWRRSAPNPHTVATAIAS